MKNNDKNILLVEDDINFGAILTDFLKLHSYNVTLAKNGIEGLEKFKKNSFGLCILDVMLPFKDGFTLAKEIRDLNKDVPLFFLTAKTLKDDVLKGYKLGADDYLTKPFDSDILLLKIKSIFKRKKITSSESNSKFLYEFANFTLNSKLRILKYNDDKDVKLSPKENELLKLLLNYKNDLMPRELALIKIWNDDNYFTSRSMDVYIAKIRKYLQKDDRLEIENIHGEGFRLKEKK
ncbi:response regulator transcription factor [Flavobacteriaceae bacterium]|jgi:DNA-binding response OmpR family regulator|nr:response regulator transcription factor [Flavobacteriaceae bacterium]MBT4231541.1 response regulator transcription factor [Flavobacteriaceae bacterium]MBT7574613.1 response regulator transcription factor [Flavobacteriaceae bacterium]MBT7984669.1 response regulator transcription factor [Flavobacteriaceae bacterium]MDA7731126.1 response regulator transcription factor [Flavobacteriaceae bacterium]